MNADWGDVVAALRARVKARDEENARLRKAIEDARVAMVALDQTLLDGYGINGPAAQSRLTNLREAIADADAEGRTK
jgi:hypothetical protein